MIGCEARTLWFLKVSKVPGEDFRHEKRREGFMAPYLIRACLVWPIIRLEDKDFAAAVEFLLHTLGCHFANGERSTHVVVGHHQRNLSAPLPI